MVEFHKNPCSLLVGVNSLPQSSATRLKKETKYLNQHKEPLSCPIAHDAKAQKTLKTTGLVNQRIKPRPDLSHR